MVEDQIEHQFKFLRHSRDVIPGSVPLIDFSIIHHRKSIIRIKDKKAKVNRGYCTLQSGSGNSRKVTNGLRQRLKPCPRM